MKRHDELSEATGLNVFTDPGCPRDQIIAWQRDALDEILAEAGIPTDHPTRVVAQRDGHRVITRTRHDAPECLLDDAFWRQQVAARPTPDPTAFVSAVKLQMQRWAAEREREMLYGVPPASLAEMEDPR